ncbi:MAG: hypothetical protein KDD60_11135, partial [Bdellovibrionales bacterium]|nr:hypothetical protein [Bdellovibrionales bacterium]
RGEVGYPVERIMRDSRIHTILEGSSEIMRLFLAREAMDPHLKKIDFLLHPERSSESKSGKILSLAGYYALWYSKQWLFSFGSSLYSEMGPFSAEFRYIERHARKLARKIFTAMARHQKGLEKKQLLLSRLMDIGTQLFVMAATCSYAILREKKGEKGAIELAKYFCALSQKRVESSFEELSHNNDSECDTLGKKIIEKKMRWLEEGIISIGPDE